MARSRRGHRTGEGEGRGAVEELRARVTGAPRHENLSGGERRRHMPPARAGHRPGGSEARGTVEELRARRVAASVEAPRDEHFARVRPRREECRGVSIARGGHRPRRHPARVDDRRIPDPTPRDPHAAARRPGVRHRASPWAARVRVIGAPVDRYRRLPLRAVGVDDVRVRDAQPGRALVVEELEDVAHEPQARDARHVDEVAKLLLRRLLLENQEVLVALCVSAVHDVAPSPGSPTPRARVASDSVRDRDRRVARAFQREGDRDVRRVVLDVDRAARDDGQLDARAPQHCALCFRWDDHAYAGVVDALEASRDTRGDDGARRERGRDRKRESTRGRGREREAGAQVCDARARVIRVDERAVSRRALRRERGVG
jgi:hypothetical protein